MNLTNLLLSTISILISVAFFTIMERKLLSYIQLRKGPNKVGVVGIIQPFSDALKLFNKDNKQMKFNNFNLSSFSPSLSMSLSAMLIPMVPINMFSEMDNKQNMIMFMIISSLFVYSILLISWSSNSKYAIMGAIRNIAQMISYEVSIFFMILFMSCMSSSYMFSEMLLNQMLLWFLWGNLIMFLMWFISSMAEMNRTPFDFAEGESELVSGFNVEYMGGLFALIFLAEYMSIIIMSMITTVMFTGQLISATNISFLILITTSILWIRGTMPRFRYDILMTTSWKFILPSVTFMTLIPFILLFH